MAVLEGACNVVQSRLIVNVPIPPGKFDYICTYPRMDDNYKALREEIEKKFHVTIRRKMVETNVLILTVQSPDALASKTSTNEFSNLVKPGAFSIRGATFFTLAADLEESLGTVIINEARIGEKFDIDLKWDSTADGFGTDSEG
jgi:hypothetical protein